MSLNKVLLIGNAGVKPEIKGTEKARFATFSLATTKYFKTASGQNSSQTEWHTIIAWGRSADFAEKYIDKGSQLFIEGELATRVWEDSKGAKHKTTEINASSIQLLGRKEQPSYTEAAAKVAQSQAASHKAAEPAQPINPELYDPTSSDDLPF